MDLIYNYSQEKKNKQNKTLGSAKLQLYQDAEYFVLCSDFIFSYTHPANPSYLTYKYLIIFNKNTGDFSTIKNSKKKYKDTKYNLQNIKPEIKNNDFSALNEILSRGIIHGESRQKYWGVKYKRATEKIHSLLLKSLNTNFNYDYHLSRTTLKKYYFNKIYLLLVDYFLDKKNIKGHDDIYHHIQQVTPNKKWLKENQMKFLPAVLDSFKIKSKYLIGELNNSNHVINLNALRNLCNLIGPNYIDYIKKLKWKDICYESSPKNNKVIALRDKTEINNFIELTTNWTNSINFLCDNLYPKISDDNGFLNRVIKLIKLRDKIEKTGMNLNFTAKNRNQFEKLEIQWTDLNTFFQRGYKLKYVYPTEFLNSIEETIYINDKKFRIKVLTTESEFLLESHYMKNCMSNQFNNGIILTFLYMESNKKRINLSYQKGQLNQAYGKANTQVPDSFKDAINVLNERFRGFSNITWKKEKYDMIK